MNEAMVEEAIKYGHYLKRSEEDIAEVIDIYKTLGDTTTYELDEERPSDNDQQQ